MKLTLLTATSGPERLSKASPRCRLVGGGAEGLTKRFANTAQSRERSRLVGLALRPGFRLKARCPPSRGGARRGGLGKQSSVAGPVRREQNEPSPVY
jgi:hypothetical protein